MASTNIYSCSLFIFFFSFDEGAGVWYYFNFETGQSSWEHPLDAQYKQFVLRARTGTVEE